MKVRVVEGKHSRIEAEGLVRYSAGMVFDATAEEISNFSDRLEVIDEPAPEAEAPAEGSTIVEEVQPYEPAGPEPAEGKVPTGEEEAADGLGGTEVVETPSEVVSEPEVESVEPEPKPEVEQPETTKISKRSSKKKAE